MKADYTRSTFKSKKHYSSVRMQQGRVQLDADWNEQMDITAHRVETETIDSIGHCGAPMHRAGFHLVKDTAGLTTEEQKIPENEIAGPAIAGGDFYISSGRYYVGGILCENEKIVLFSKQPDVPLDAVLNSLPVNFPGRKEILKEIQPPSQSGTYLAYLDVWSGHISALEDKEIREVALGGPDTATRTKTIWQVKLLRVGGPGAKINCLSSSEDAGALEVHHALIAWEALVEGPNGKLAAKVEEQEEDKDKPCIVAPGAGYRRLENQLYRVEVHKGGKLGQATFKWSRDNGTVVAKWEDQDADKLTVSSTGRDNVLNFAGGQWVELTDDTRELLGQPGTLVKLKKVEKEGSVLTIDATTKTGSVKLSEFPGNPRVRRWDTRAGEPAELNPQPGDEFIDLEDGVQVEFSDGTYRTGDYWLVPARTATADVEWPVDHAGKPELQSPQGIRHHYCRLAILRFGGPQGPATKISDCRRTFPPVTELTSLFYVSGDGQEAIPGAKLPKPLQVGVSNGRWPVSTVRIRFKRLDGGVLLPGVSTVVPVPGGPADELVVLTGPEGVAECYWQLDPNTGKPSQQVEAILWDAADDPVHLPIRFTANLSIASQVYYDTNECANLQGADNVQLALDKLSQHKTISYHAGDGQEALPGHALPQLLQVRVANKCGPVVRDKVRFATMEGGKLSEKLHPFSDAGNAIEVHTKGGGIASCAWKLKDDPVNNPSQQLVATLIPSDGDDSSIQPSNTIVFTANLSLARQVAYDSKDCSNLRQAEANNVQDAIDGLCTQLELLTRCCRFLDDLRANGIVADERGVLGFEVTKSSSDSLTVDYTGGVAYVGGCRYELEAGQMTVNASASGQLLLIDDEGKVVLIYEVAPPTRYALLAIIHTYQGDIKRIVDVRRNLTHLDEKVEANVHRVASSHPDRRQFVPLLAQTLPDLQYRDGRNYTFTGTGQAYGLVFDGKAVWVPNLGGTSVSRIDCKASDDSGVTTVDTSDRTYAGAFDGKYVWLTSPRKVNPAGDGLDPNNKVLLINSETLDVENTLTTGDGPFAIAFDGNFMWVANTESNSVSLFDIETHEEVRTIGLEKSPPRALAFDGTYMWIASANGSLVRIQGHRGDPEEVALPDSIRRLWGQLVFDGSSIWAKGGGGQIIKINVVPLGVTDNVINCEVIPVTEQFPGSPAWLGGMVFDGRHMWIPAQAQSSDNRYIVHKGDADTNNNLGSIQLQQTAVTCGAFDGAHLWFAGLTPTVSKILIG